MNKLDQMIETGETSEIKVFDAAHGVYSINYNGENTFSDPHSCGFEQVYGKAVSLP